MTPKVKSKSKPKVKTKVKQRPVLWTGDKKFDEEVNNILINAEFTKIRNQRKELSKKFGKKFDDWYNTVKDVNIIKAGQKELLQYRKAIRGYLNLKRKPKLLPHQPIIVKEPVEVLKFDKLNSRLTINEYNSLTEKQKQLYFRKNHKNFALHAFYIEGADNKNVDVDETRPTEDVLKNLDKFKKIKRNNELEYEKKYHTQNLTHAQLFLVATTTPDGAVPKYMGRPLSRLNQIFLRHYKMTSAGYREWLKAKDRIEANRKKGDDKQHVTLKNKIEEYQKLGERLRKSSYLPELEVYNTLKSLIPEANIQREQTYYDSDGKKRKSDMSIKFPDGDAHLEVKAGDKITLSVGNVNVQTTNNTNLMARSVKYPDVVREHGFVEYINRNGLPSIFDFPEHFLKNNSPTTLDYRVADYFDGVALAKSFGMQPFDFFNMTCDYLARTRSTYEKAKALDRGMCAEEIVNFYDNKVAEVNKKNEGLSKNKRLPKYTQTDLWNSNFCKEWIKKWNLSKWFKTYKDFNKVFNGLYKQTKSVAKKIN